MIGWKLLIGIATRQMPTRTDGRFVSILSNHRSHVNNHLDNSIARYFLRGSIIPWSFRRRPPERSTLQILVVAPSLSSSSGVLAVAWRRHKFPTHALAAMMPGTTMQSSAKRFFLAVFLLSVPAHSSLVKDKEPSPFAPDLCAVSRWLLLHPEIFFKYWLLGRLFR